MNQTILEKIPPYITCDKLFKEISGDALFKSDENLSGYFSEKYSGQIAKTASEIFEEFNPKVIPLSVIVSFLLESGKKEGWYVFFTGFHGRLYMIFWNVIGTCLSAYPMDSTLWHKCVYVVEKNSKEDKEKQRPKNDLMNIFIETKSNASERVIELEVQIDIRDNLNHIATALELLSQTNQKKE